MITSYALECTVHFLSEQRSKLYKRYCLGVAQLKNVLCAENGLERLALPVLERRGA